MWMVMSGPLRRFVSAFVCLWFLLCWPIFVPICANDIVVSCRVVAFVTIHRFNGAFSFLLILTTRYVSKQVSRCFFLSPLSLKVCNRMEKDVWGKPGALGWGRTMRFRFVFQSTSNINAHDENRSILILLGDYLISPSIPFQIPERQDLYCKWPSICKRNSAR